MNTQSIWNLDVDCTKFFPWILLLPLLLLLQPPTGTWCFRTFVGP